MFALIFPWDMGAVCLGVPCIVCPSAAGTQITPCARVGVSSSDPIRSDPADPRHSLSDSAALGDACSDARLIKRAGVVVHA